MFGHKKGNEVLRLIAMTIKNNIRSVDLVARLGGDEFIVLFPETEDKAAYVVISRVESQLLKMMSENRYPISVSIGFATFDKPLDSIEKMVSEVDSLMYMAKKNGKSILGHKLTQ